MIPSAPLWLPLALQASTGQNPLYSLAPMVLVFAIFYFVLLWPMRKQRKALQQMIENLQKGDRIVTSGGLYGEVAAVDGPTVLLKIADNVKVRIAKSAVAGLEADDRTKGDKV